MIDSLVQQFAGSEVQSLEGEALHGGVAQMLGSAPNEHGIGAITQALGALGGSGLGQSVAQGAAQASPQQWNGLADLLLKAVSQGGGSPSNALSQLGIGGGGSLGPQELGTLAEYVGNNHSDALAQVLGNHFGSGGSGSGSSGLLSLLGSPMVREVGMKLAKRLL
jgi:hypothetical protein